MAPLLNLNPYQPIPNNPFAYPETYFVYGPTGPLITGINIFVDPILGTINAVPPTGNVTSITAGTGLTGGTITSTGTIALAPTGVAAGVYTLPTLTLNSLGQISAISANPAPGTVCTVNTGTGLTGGPVTTSGTISIAPTGVTAGTYNYATFNVNAQGQLTSASSNVPVTAITAGTGLTGGTITSTGSISITNTGVAAGTYALPTIDVNAQGQITNAVAGVAVTCITTGTGLQGGPITTIGQIALTNTGVTAGNYTFSNINVDAQGRIGSVSNGVAVTNLATSGGIVGGPITGVGTICLQTLAPSSAGAYSFSNVTVDIYGRVVTASSGSLCTAITGALPITVTGNDTSVVVGINNASTTALGAVALTDDLITNDPNTALTAAQGYSLQQQVTALATSTSNLTLVGTFDAFTGLLLTVTAEGTAEGFAVGSDLVAPAALNENSFVIVTTGGTYSPPSGGGPFVANQGDWFLSNAVVWQFLNVGYDEPYATTLNPGIIEIATLAETQTGTDGTRAVTPDTLAQTYVPNSDYATKGDVLIATSAGVYSALSVSATNNQPLVSCSSATTGIAYGEIAIPQTLLTTKGDLIAADATGVPSRFGVGVNGQVLTADSAQPLGVGWCSQGVPIPIACLTGKGALVSASAANTATPLSYSGNDGDLLQVCTTCATGLTWAPLSGFIPCSCITGKGALITGTAVDSPTALAVGADSYVLTACAAAGTGLTWCPNPPAIPCSAISGKGAIVVGSAASTPASITVGANGQYLIACALAVTGLCWVTPPPPSIPCAIITGKGSLIVGIADNTPAAFPLGGDGSVLSVNSSCGGGIEWVPFTPAIPCACLSAKGSIVAASATNTPANFAIGANGQVLTACSGCAQGLVWNTPTSDIPCSVLTAKGDTIVASGANTPTALPVGTNGQVIVACSACSAGVTYAQPFVECSCFTAKGEILGGTGAGTFSALGAAAADCYWVISCASCSNGITWSNTPNTLGDTPVGAVSFFAGISAPYGWVVANGAAVSRTTYATLFAQIGNIYGAGDGSTTFNLPDLRGQFARGWDAAGGSARGCDVGRAFGSTQGATQVWQGIDVFGGAAGFRSNGEQPVAGGFPSAGHARASSTPGTAVTGSCGVRPSNVAMLPCIKWLVTTPPPGPSTCGIPCQCLVGRGSLVTATAANTPVALPIGGNYQLLRPNTGCSTGIEWSDVGKTNSALVGPGQVVCMDNLKVDWSQTPGSRNLRLATISGTAVADVQGTYSQASAVGSQNNTNFALNTAFQNIGTFNFANVAACVTFMVGINDANSDYVCAYNITGIVGDAFRCNIICITRVV